MLQECEFCDDAKYEGMKVKEYKYWKIYLHTNQSYLGWCTIRLKRHLEDFFDIDEDELREVFRITKQLRDATKELFSPAMFNYATLGNVTRHVHLHFIPRYSKKVSFAGFVFEDKKFGQNYFPYDKNFEVPEEVKQEIKNKLSSRLR